MKVLTNEEISGENVKKILMAGWKSVNESVKILANEEIWKLNGLSQWKQKNRSESQNEIEEIEIVAKIYNMKEKYQCNLENKWEMTWKLIMKTTWRRRMKIEWERKIRKPSGWRQWRKWNSERIEIMQKKAVIVI